MFNTKELYIIKDKNMLITIQKQEKITAIYKIVGDDAFFDYKYSATWYKKSRVFCINFIF